MEDVFVSIFVQVDGDFIDHPQGDRVPRITCSHLDSLIAVRKSAWHSSSGFLASRLLSHQMFSIESTSTIFTLGIRPIPHLCPLHLSLVSDPRIWPRPLVWLTFCSQPSGETLESEGFHLWSVGIIVDSDGERTFSQHAPWTPKPVTPLRLDMLV